MNKWFLFAPIKETMKDVNTTKKFFHAMFTLFGRTITSLSALEFECYLKRLHGNYLELVQEIANQTPPSLILKLLEKYSGRLDFYNVFSKLIPMTKYDVKHLWRKSTPSQSQIEYGAYVPSGSFFFHHMSQNQYSKCPLPIRNRLFALMRACRYMHRDLRRVLCHFVMSLELDYIVCFASVAGNSADDLETAFETFNGYKPSKKKLKGTEDRNLIAHAVTLKIVTKGFACQEVSQFIFRTIDTNNRRYLNWVLWRMRLLPFSHVSQELYHFYVIGHLEQRFPDLIGRVRAAFYPSFHPRHFEDALDKRWFVREMILYLRRGREELRRGYESIMTEEVMQLYCEMK